MKRRRKGREGGGGRGRGRRDILTGYGQSTDRELTAQKS